MKNFQWIFFTLLGLALMSLLYLKVSFAEEFDLWEEDFGDYEFEMEEIPASAGMTEEEIYNGKVKMKADFLDGDILKISIMAEEMQIPVLGMSFNLLYSDKLAFLKYDPGDFLERGGDPFYLVKNDEKDNKIIFGETLRRNDSFPLGEGQIADLYFQILERMALQFNFKNGVISSMDTVRQDIDKILWQDLALDKNGKEIIDLNEKKITGIDNLNKNPFGWENFVVGLVLGMGFFGIILFFVYWFKNRRKYSIEGGRVISLVKGKMN